MESGALGANGGFPDGLIALKDLSQVAGAATGLVDAIRGFAQPRPRGRRR